jgi:hypothetical protein
LDGRGPAKMPPTPVKGKQEPIATWAVDDLGA